MMKNESGRSMVEMLGVLAIIGVLSIGGIAGYTVAMNRYRANEILDTAAKVSVLGMTKMTGKAYMKEDLGITEVHGVTNMQAGNTGVVTLKWGGGSYGDIQNAMNSIAGAKYKKSALTTFDPTK